MSRSVKLTVINDFVCFPYSLHVVSLLTTYLKVCPNCCIGQHELLNAITYCKENLQLPLNFELVHMPFRLVSTNILSEESPKMEKTDFYQKQLGEDRFMKMKEGITNWANKNGIPMCADIYRSARFLTYNILLTVHSRALLAKLLAPTVSARKHTSSADKIFRFPFSEPFTKPTWKQGRILPK